MSKLERPSRGQTSENIDHRREKMKEKGEVCEEVVSDAESVRDIRGQLRGEGTSEGMDKALESVDKAEEVTIEVFDGHDQELNEIQDENREHEEDLSDRNTANHEDLEILSDRGAEIKTSETISEVVEAKSATLEDIEFLDKAFQELESNRKQSEEALNEYENRIRAGKGH